MAEMVYVGKERLVGEVIRLTNDITTIQVRGKPQDFVLVTR